MKLALLAAHITKTYNGNQVLNDCTFSFERSGIYVLTGPNGCGKSTFLRICSLLEEPDKGEIFYIEGGTVLPCDIALRRRMTLVLPKVGLFNATVFKNVDYGLRIRGTKGKEAADRVDKVLDFVSLAHKKDQNALTLSSGETQRAGLARALVIEPDVLFLDEPTASIDEKSTRAIEDIIQRLKQDGNCTIVMTTHDHSQAARLADFLMVMKDGKISAS
jgi:tungstate transport system ATP-binding protein